MYTYVLLIIILRTEYESKTKILDFYRKINNIWPKFQFAMFIFGGDGNKAVARGSFFPLFF